MPTVKKLHDDLYSLYTNNTLQYVNAHNAHLWGLGKDFEFCDIPSEVPASPNTHQKEYTVDKGSKYLVTVRNRHTGETIECDVYDVLEAFKITCSAMAHALKKFLLAGNRGVKDFGKDCDEGINSVEQSKLLQKYRDK